MVISGIVFARCHSDHSVFVHCTKFGSVILTMYVDDILLTESDYVALTETRVSQQSFCDEEYGKAKIIPWD